MVDGKVQKDWEYDSYAQSRESNVFLTRRMSYRQSFLHRGRSRWRDLDVLRTIQVAYQGLTNASRHFQFPCKHPEVSQAAASFKMTVSTQHGSIFGEVRTLSVKLDANSAEVKRKMPVHSERHVYSGYRRRNRDIKKPYEIHGLRETPKTAGVCANLDECQG